MGAGNGTGALRHLIVGGGMAGHAAAALRFGRRRRGHVVAHQDGFHGDVFHVGHFRGHVEIHHVAGVVAINQHNPPAAVDAADHLEHLVGAGGGKYVANRAAIQHAAPHVAKEDGQVPRAPAGRQGNFMGHRGICTHHAV